MSRSRRRAPKKLRRAPRLDAVVRAVGRGGDALVDDAEHGTVFVPGAWTGETIRYQVAAKRRGVARGRLLEVLTPAATRRVAPCEVAGRCGGCPWMFMEESTQRNEKTAQLEHAFSRLGFGEPIPLHSGSALRYRRRARLVFNNGRAGYRASGTPGADGKSMVDVRTCPVLHPALELAFQAFREVLLPNLVGPGEVSLSRRDEGAVLAIRTANAQPAEAYSAAKALNDTAGVFGVAFAVGDTAPAVFGVPIERTLGMDEQPLTGTTLGFSQAHDELNSTLASRVAAQIGEDASVLELYAGHGNLTVGIARRAKSTVAVENDRDAVKALRENVREREIKVRVVEADAAAFPAGRFSTLVVDPPRSGAREPLERIASSKALRRIVYVSCDPATLTRDLTFLGEQGFGIRSVEAFDLFPQTPHVETLVVLDRR